MQKKSIIACLPAATAPRVPTPMPLSAAAKELRSVPAGGIRRRDRTVAAAASRTGPVEAARAYASQGNDVRQAAAASDPTAVASGKAKLEGRPPAPYASRPTTYRAGKGKVWLSPLGLNFPASPCRSPPFPTRQSPGLRPSAQPTETTHSGCSRSDRVSAAAILNFLTPRRRWRRLPGRWKLVEVEEQGAEASRMC